MANIINKSHSAYVETFSTCNRNLEGFMYAHRINFLFQRKNEDGITFWTYLKDERFMEVLAEYKSLYPEFHAS